MNRAARRLCAELLAWPLVAPRALSARPRTLGELKPLLPSFEQRASELCAAVDLPEHLPGLLKPLEENPDTSLLDWWQVHARTFLHREGPRWHLQRLRRPNPRRFDRPVQPRVEVLRWRAITLAQPAGWFLALAARPGERPPLQVDLLRGHEAPQHKIVHHHVHVGAAQPFEHIWSRLAASPDATQGSNQPLMTDWQRWLVRALVARRWLAFRCGLQTRWPRPPGLSRQEAHRLTQVAIRDLLAYPTIASSPRSGDDGRLSRLAAWTGRRSGSATENDPWKVDPIADGRRWPEGALLWSAIQYIRARPADSEFETVLFQVLRIKAALYRYVVSDPARPGLTTFTQTYRRLRPFRRAGPLAGLRDTAHDPTVPLAGVEVRTAPPESLSGLLDLVAPKVEMAGEADAAARGLEWGWTFHFLRSTGDLLPAQSVGSRPGQRMRAAHTRARRGAGNLLRAIRRWPQLLSVVRALDIAGDERSGPIWLFVPFFSQLREASRRASVRLRRSGIPPLRTTLHAGEDYRHLLTGIRAVHEPVAWDLIQPGDRIGHALVLGVDPARWIEERKNASVDQPRWERLRDICWAIEAAESLRIGLLQERRENLLKDARDLARDIWGEALASDLFPADIKRPPGLCLSGHLGDPQLLERVGAHLRVPPRPDSPLDVAVQSLLFQPAVGERAWSTVAVNARRDADLVRALHRETRALLSAMGVCVEINPSSNDLIAGFESPVDQPAFHVVPVDAAHRDAVAISINADDPTTFATRLSDELALARAALIVDGNHAPEAVQAWMELAASASWRYRFTTPTSAGLREALRPPGVGPGYRQWVHLPRQFD